VLGRSPAPCALSQRVSPASGLALPVSAPGRSPGTSRARSASLDDIRDPHAGHSCKRPFTAVLLICNARARQRTNTPEPPENRGRRRLIGYALISIEDAGIKGRAPDRTLWQIAAAPLEAMRERMPRSGTRWHLSSVKHLLDRGARLG